MTDSKRVKAALLVGPGAMPTWLADAIRTAVAAGIEIPLVLRCDNPLYVRCPIKHGLYYLLNILVMRRGEEEKAVLVDELGLANFAEHRFSAEPSSRRGWQKIPSEVGEKVKQYDCEVVIKAGMGLLENPDAACAPLGIISYHHGDPARFRGRPSGFWEIMEGAQTMGFMVQRITDELDAGEVLAFGRSKVFAYSYRQTLACSRRLSSPLLLKAIKAAKRGEKLKVSTNGRNYRLPSNTQVVCFLAKVFWAKLRRLFYGAFIEKSWHIGITDALVDLAGEVRLQVPPPLPTPQGYVFLADGFWGREGEIFAEAMRPDGLAELVQIKPSGLSVISDNPRGHWSYPIFFSHDESGLILPEVSAWSAPFMLREPGDLKRVYLRGLEAERLVDPTLLYHNKHWYLFATTAPLENERLRLWVSSAGPEGPYAEHPDSPVVLDATSARMGGPFFKQGDYVLRFGQDFSGGYGSAISVQKLVEISPSRYVEANVARISVGGAKGPHSYSVLNGKALLDWYVESFSPCAGLRRLVARMSLRR